jgi:metal-sulfur cluster biosynthetic enzyme
MTTETTEDVGRQVKQALHTVIDPELGYNIVDLGMVYDVGIAADGIAHITMTTTTRGCPATSYLVDGARAAVETVPSVSGVEVELTYDPPWEPAMMTDEAKEHLDIGGGW